MEDTLVDRVLDALKRRLKLAFPIVVFVVFYGNPLGTRDAAFAYALHRAQSTANVFLGWYTDYVSHLPGVQPTPTISPVRP